MRGFDVRELSLATPLSSQTALKGETLLNRNEKVLHSYAHLNYMCIDSMMRGNFSQFEKRTIIAASMDAQEISSRLYGMLNKMLQREAFTTKCSNAGSISAVGVPLAPIRWKDARSQRKIRDFTKRA